MFDPPFRLSLEWNREGDRNMRRNIGWLFGFALILAAAIAPAQAHHVMDYALPATASEGFLSGIGHPVIGVDHLIFIAGAGVLAAQFRRGFLLPLLFVVASTLAAAARYSGADMAMGELPVAGSLVVLATILLVAQTPGAAVIGVLFLIAGTIHGYALAEAIVGAERTPLVAYLAGLTVVQCAIALAAWRIATWAAARYPKLPTRRLAGAATGIAGLVFTAMALMG